MNWYEVAKTILGFGFGGILVWGVLVMRRNEREEQKIRIEMKKAATQRSTEAWAKTYDYECMMHNREVAALKREIESLKEEKEALERQLATWDMIGRVTKLSEVCNEAGRTTD